MSEIREKLMNDIEKMFEDIIDTSLNYIEIDKQQEYIKDCVKILIIHKININLIRKQYGDDKNGRNK